MVAHTVKHVMKESACTFIIHFTSPVRREHNGDYSIHGVIIDEDLVVSQDFDVRALTLRPIAMIDSELVNDVTKSGQPLVSIRWIDTFFEEEHQTLIPVELIEKIERSSTITFEPVR